MGTKGSFEADLDGGIAVSGLAQGLLVFLDAAKIAGVLVRHHLHVHRRPCVGGVSARAPALNLRCTDTG